MSRTILILLLAIDALHVILHVFFGDRFDLLNLDRERTPAALFSSLQYIGASFALVWLLVTTRTKKMHILWSVSSFLFLMMGLDEISELHENVAYYLIKYVPPLPFFHSGTPMWIVFLSPLILASFVMLAYVTRLLMKNSRRSGWAALAGLLLFGFALALEFAGGTTSLQSLLPIFIPLEEGSELLAGTLFLFSFSTLAKEEFEKTFQRKFGETH